ncbi:MAG: Uncharacterised protein [Acidimicrobiales bacterium AG-410-I20]|nr:MAG: Uncharacterised protein [Acidimicrobiales bacterium AG-410-I20]
MNSLSLEHGWLGSPSEVPWPSTNTEDEPLDLNPFIKFRHFLWSYQNALKKGMTDGEFVDLVSLLDDSIKQVDGISFTHTPFNSHSELNSSIGRKGSLWIKNESKNVSGSHKARHLFGLALHFEVDRVPSDTPLTIASCGNAALGAAVVAKATNRPLIVHVPEWADPVILSHLSDLGAEIRICERREEERGDPCLLRFREAVAQGAIPFGCQGTENIFTIDGGRTLGFELAQDWKSNEHIPEHLFIQVGGGALASSVIQALNTALDLGVLTNLPSFHAVQSAGCAPLNRAFNIVTSLEDPFDGLNDDDPMWAWENPHSVATGILDDVVYDWKPIVWAMLQMGGSPVIASEEAITRAHQLVHSHTDISPCITGTSGLAGVITNHENELLDADSNVAVLVTGIER